MVGFTSGILKKYMLYCEKLRYNHITNVQGEKPMKELWKKFDEVELTHSSVHHLMAMHELLKKNGYVRGVDIANHLNISRSSVSITLKKIKHKGYIVEDENKFFHLTDEGLSLINSVLSKRRIIQLFFKSVLNLPESIAEAEACKVEHLLEEETGHKLMSFMGFFMSNSKIAASFRKDFKNFTFQCNKTENCEICELDCYLAQGQKH
jgi:DtxR family Mn-dependent transcriptional regulator